MAATQRTTSTIPSNPPYLANVYFQDGLRLTVALCALLYLVLSTSLDAAGHVREGMSMLLPVTMGSLLLSALMSFSRFDGFFAFSHSMFTGLAWILFLMAQQARQEDLQTILDRGIPDLQARAYFVLLRLQNWLDAALNNKASADNTVFIFEIALLVWWLSYLGMWSIVRHGYTWRAIIPAGVVLLINTYYAPKPVFSFLFVFTLIGLVLLVRTNLAEKQRIWREQRIYFSQDITWDFMRNGLIYALVVLALAVIVPNLGSNPIIRSALSPISDRWMRTQQEVSRLYEGMNRRVTTTQAGFGSQMQLGGERNVGSTWLYSVQAIQPRYWRAVVYDEYTGRGWRNSGEDNFQFDTNQAIPVPGWSARQEISQTITVLAAVGSTVIGAPDIRIASLPLKARVGSSPAQPFFGSSVDTIKTETGAVELTMINTTRDLDVGDKYVVYSNATDVTIAQLREAGTNYPQSILDKYLQLPENFSPRVRKLAEDTVVGLSTPYDKAKAIETYLRSIKYDDAIPAPGPNVDPLEYFLFDIRRGYCDYYASSMVTMLRSVGVPARPASGYAEGLYDDESGVYFIGEKDAHTWVEVFFPSLGWVEFEPTAAESPLTRPEKETEVNTTLGNNNEPKYEEGTVFPTTDPLLGNNQSLQDEPQDPGVAPTESRALLPWWAWLIITPILLLLGLRLLWQLQMGVPTAFTTDIAPILYERMQRWAERLRLPFPAHFTPFEQEKRLSQAMPQAQEPIRVVTRSFVYHQFAPQAHNHQNGNHVASEEEHRLLDAWRTMLPIFVKKWATQWLPGQNGTNNSHFTVENNVRSERVIPKAGLRRRKRREKQ
ncbi:MAG: transglutaminaseTgpA domain-containing protein [Caldilineaceae bacterium]